MGFVLSFRFSIGRLTQNMNKVAPQDDSVFNIQVSYIAPRYGLDQTQCICRICLQQDITDPAKLMDMSDSQKQQLELIVPCQCSGSVAFVHQKCIKMWMQKQLQISGGKRGFCQICKAEIYFKMLKTKYCECKLGKCLDISPCNVVCVITELILIVVVALVNSYTQKLIHFDLLRYVLTALMVLLIITFVLTIVLIIRQTFLKTVKSMQKVYSVMQAEELGFKESRVIKTAKILSSKNTPVSVKKIKRSRNSGASQRPFNNPFDSINPVQFMAF